MEFLKRPIFLEKDLALIKAVLAGACHMARQEHDVLRSFRKCRVKSAGGVKKKKSLYD
jgi:hypothetical protein